MGDIDRHELQNVLPNEVKTLNGNLEAGFHRDETPTTMPSVCGSYRFSLTGGTPISAQAP